MSYCRKAARATLVLIPLLGLQYLVLPMRPQPDSELEHIYLYSIAILTSLQVIIVIRTHVSTGDKNKHI